MCVGNASKALAATPSVSSAAHSAESRGQLWTRGIERRWLACFAARSPRSNRPQVLARGLVMLKTQSRQHWRFVIAAPSLGLLRSSLCDSTSHCFIYPSSRSKSRRSPMGRTHHVRHVVRREPSPSKSSKRCKRMETSSAEGHSVARPNILWSPPR